MDRLVDFLLNFYGPTPYMLVFAILIGCGLGVPLPEDIILFAAGLLSYYGLTQLWVMIVIAMAGVLIGDSTIFFLGAVYGRKLTKKWFHQRGNKLIFAARFMPGLRAPIFFSAGTLHLPYRVFLFYDGMAALISVPAIIGAVYYFGDQLDYVVRVIQHIEHGILLVIVVAVLAILGKWYLTHRRLRRV